MKATAWRQKIWVAVALTTVACASGGADEATEEAPSPRLAASGECVTGTVFAGGLDIAPRTLVHPAEGPRVELVGELVGNVRLLAGTVVEVCGPDRTQSDELEVSRVALLRVDGMPAALGTLTSDSSGWRLDPIGGGEPVSIIGLPPGLLTAADRVVWVAGLLQDGQLLVRSYSVLDGWR